MLKQKRNIFIVCEFVGIGLSPVSHILFAQGVVARHESVF
jgi:hypothetical protein